VEIRWVRSVSMYRPVPKSINGQARPWAAGVFRTRYNFGNYILDWTSGGGACHVSSRKLWQRLLSSGQRCPSPLRCLLQVVLSQFGPAVGTIVRRSGHASALPAGTRCVRVFHGPRPLQVVLAGPDLSGGWVCLAPAGLNSHVGAKQNRQCQSMWVGNPFPDTGWPP